MANVISNLAVIGASSLLIRNSFKKGKGGIDTATAPPEISFNGQSLGQDNRVRIQVPTEYLNKTTSGSSKNELATIGGVLFPYTPTISYERKAGYSSQTPLHSNFTQYFYQHSSVSPISISGKFTVQNDTDGNIYLATVQLLSALTKMRTGDDAKAGSPPPVCRLNAYGLFGLFNVPVVIEAFKLELPDTVDYFTINKAASSIFGKTTVPTVSTITLQCNPVYSRDEMQKFSVPEWLSSGASRFKGYL